MNNKYSDFNKQKYILQNQALSSLVVNLPYKIDGFTTSPKISKILSFPLGIKVDSRLLYKLFFQFITSMTSLMAISSICILLIYLPLQNYNSHLFNNVKKLTNQKFNLLANLQENSTYKKLFTSADKFSLKDTDEIIHIRTSPNFSYKPEILTMFSRYPSIQFSGF